MWTGTTECCLEWLKEHGTSTEPRDTAKALTLLPSVRSTTSVYTRLHTLSPSFDRSFNVLNPTTCTNQSSVHATRRLSLELRYCEKELVRLDITLTIHIACQ